jgi:hypothetical protein
VLGNRTNLHDAQLAGAATGRLRADLRADAVLPIIRQIEASGITTKAAIAEELNRRRVPTARGGVWSHKSVGNVMARGA